MRAIQIHDTPTPSPSLLDLLKSHLPHSLPVLRRLQFLQNFPAAGRTAHSHVVHAHYRQEDEVVGGDKAAGGSWKGGASERGAGEGAGEEKGRDCGSHVAVAFVDLSSGRETQVWVYSSLEDGERHDKTNDESDDAVRAGGSRFASWAGERTEQEEEALDLVLAVLRRVRATAAATISSSSSSSSSGPQAEEENKEGGMIRTGEVLVGSMHESVRQGLLARGVRMRKSINEPPNAEWDFYGKWLFRVENLPLPADHPLPEGMRWDRIGVEDIDLVLERTVIKRRPNTLLKLPSVVIRLNDETPIAWAFIGLDGTLSTLNVEEAYRQRGLARALVCKLIRERLPEYGDDGWGAADVSVGNYKSQALCRSVGGKNRWITSWALVDLSSVGEPM
ncbi:hypothetical protein C7999DRAFT_27563 [Corynascus novoguineensis]|uniref:FR47-like domain-containing protein n=1 Tax=Corynascus novoguineensis TaxID=1126955 RepID=A0AAN7HIY2_9PEZI|nr:hypothetical protein C7999DRAFT_27563 [Corynascus novoguineensis]